MQMKGLRPWMANILGRHDPYRYRIAVMQCLLYKKWWRVDDSTRLFLINHISKLFSKPLIPPYNIRLRRLIAAKSKLIPPTLIDVVKKLMDTARWINGAEKIMTLAKGVMKENTQLSGVKIFNPYSWRLDQLTEFKFKWVGYLCFIFMFILSLFNSFVF